MTAATIKNRISQNNGPKCLKINLNQILKLVSKLKMKGIVEIWQTGFQIS